LFFSPPRTPSVSIFRVFGFKFLLFDPPTFFFFWRLFLFLHLLLQAKDLAGKSCVPFFSLFCFFFFPPVPPRPPFLPTCSSLPFERCPEQMFVFGAVSPRLEVFFPPSFDHCLQRLSPFFEHFLVDGFFWARPHCFNDFSFFLGALALLHDKPLFPFPRKFLFFPRCFPFDPWPPTEPLFFSRFPDGSPS